MSHPMRYLLDTNICIYIINQRPPQVVQKMRQYPLGELVISTLTVAELAYGMAKSRHPERNQQALAQFLTPFELLDFSVEAAQEYGRLRVALEDQGTPIGLVDMLLAAQAISHQLVLVTNNTREFGRIAHLPLENWVDG